MPFEPVSPYGGFTGTTAAPERAPVSSADDSIWGAAFRTENIVGSSMASEEVRTANEQEGVLGGPVRIDPDFDPWAEIVDTPYESYTDQFALAGNKDHFEAIKADIDRETKDRETIHKSGWTGIGASMAAGVLDLPILLPGGNLIRSAKGGVSLLRTAGSTAAYGTLAAAASETVLQGSQELRTGTESAVVIGGSTVLAGLLGAGFGKLFSRADQAAFAARVEQDFRVPGIDESDPFIPGGVKVEAAPGASPQAASVADIIRQTAEEILPPQVRVQVADSIGLPKAGAADADGMFALRGFYSPAIRAVEGISQAKGTGEQFWKQLTKVGGVKKDELDWMGVEEFLKGKPSVTKAEVLDFMRAHQVELDETVYPKPQAEFQAIRDKLFAERDAAKAAGNEARVAEINEEWKQTRLEWAPEKVNTKFSDHKVPGGENYRELLIRLPELGPRELSATEKNQFNTLSAERDRLLDEYNNIWQTEPERAIKVYEETSEIIAKIGDLYKKTEPKYTSKHFDDQEVVHLRVDDRTGPNGEKVLFINEVQSDLLQATRKFGFGKEGYEKAKFEVERLYDDKVVNDAIVHIAKAENSSVDEVLENYGFTNRDDYIIVAGEKYEFEGRPDTESKTRFAAQRYIDTFGERGAPKVPLSSDSAIEIALKRALLYAAEGGYDAISWARSDQVAKAVGAQPADLALQYDKNMGKFLDKYTKKWGGKVEETDAVTGPQGAANGRVLASLDENIADVRRRLESDPDGAQLLRASLNNLEAQRARISSDATDVGTNPLLRITPEMRASVIEGQPLSVRQGSEGKVAEGRFDPDQLLITISANALDPVKTLKHEGIHALRTMGLFTGKEWGTLEAAARKQGWVESNNVRGLYEGVYKDRITDDLLTEEAIAEQFSLWRQGAKNVTGTIAKLFERIQEFLDRVGNALRGQGFQTADDVFASVKGGDVAGRATPAGRSMPAGGALAAGSGRAASVGAAARETVDNTLKPALGLETVRIDPLIYLQNSKSDKTKAYIQELAETPLAYKKNADGFETAPIGSEMGEPGAVESRIKGWQAPLAESVKTLENAFMRYRKGRDKILGDQLRMTIGDAISAPEKLTWRQFKEEVAKAARRGDAHEIPEVAQAAKFARQNVFDPLKDRAIAKELLPEDISAETAESYLNRLYNKEKIIARRPEFKEIVTQWLDEVEFRNGVTRRQLEPLLTRLDEMQDAAKKAAKKPKAAGKKAKPVDPAEAEAAAAKAAEDKAEMTELQEQIEALVLKYEGKTKAEAEIAVKAREKAEAGRDPAAKRLTAADKPIIRAARKIIERTDKEAGETADLADQIIDRILGTPDGRLPYDAHLNRTTDSNGVSSSARGPLAAREFMIPDEMIEDFLENDFEMLMHAYVRTMAPDVELHARFGDMDMKLQMKEIQEDWARKAASAKTEKERRSLHAQRDGDIRRLAAIRDRLRGTYALPSNPDGLMLRTGRVLRSVNYMAMLGGQVVSAIPDMGSIVFSHGIMRTFGDGIIPLFRNFSGTRLAAREVKLAGTALDMVLDSRAMNIGEIMDDYGRHSKFERGVQSMARSFGTVSLMSPWNAAMKQTAGLITMSRIIRASDALARGKISKPELERLAASGISRDNALKIAEQFKKHGERDGGVWLPHTENWDAEARAAKEAFRVALVREVDKTIITPGQEKYLWMSTELGKTLGQFKSFSVSANQRLLIAGLQNRDMGNLSGVALMVALGGLVHILKTKASGRDPGIDWNDNEKTSQFMVNAVDRSGLLGALMELNAMSEKLTGGQVGLSKLTGRPISRYASRNLVGAMAGPTFGTLQSIGQVSSAGFSEWKETDTRAARRLIPYQNLLYMRTLFDKAESGINDFFGVPKTATRH
jgi:hypothetical protein